MRASWVCVDASLVADPRDGSIVRLWERWDADRQQLAAPAMLYYEVTNALHRYHHLGLMSASSVRLALRAALSRPHTRVQRGQSALASSGTGQAAIAPDCVRCALPGARGVAGR